MDNKKGNDSFCPERDILFSQAVKAGKRVYYIDVKCSKRDELFLSITESKRVSVEGNEDGSFNFEKHKIFLYQEDFVKFIDAFSNAVHFIHEHNGEHAVNHRVDTYVSEEDEGAELDLAEPSASENGDAEYVDDLPGNIDINIEF